MLGFYFDTFLKANHFKKSKDQILHAKDRVVSNFSQAENELTQGLEFIKEDQEFLASISLINNYQNKDDYNAILLDEEKKELATYLLAKVKASFNANITLYDKNGELVAYVYKEKKQYILNFISYENAKKVFYSKPETASEYTKSYNFVNRGIPLKHVAYYRQPELKKGVVVTYHDVGDTIQIIAHNSIFDKQNPQKTNAHIEMGKKFGAEYFQNIYDDLGIKVSLSQDVQYKNKSLAFYGNSLFEDKNLLQESNNYLCIFSLGTKNGDVYLLFELNKKVLNDTLHQNRVQLILFLIISIIVIMIIFHLLIRLRISTPLAKLMQQISKIEDGDYTTSEIVQTADELEVVSENINNLASSLHKREISLRASQNQLEYLSTHDELTGLLNRRSFSTNLEHALKKADRNKTKLAVLFLDLDEFKQVNDTLGHSAGDALLSAVANRLQGHLRSSDVLARVGGDEFNIFVEGFSNITELQVLTQKVLDAFIEPFVDLEAEIVSSTSIGIALYPDDGKDVETLIKNADLAMYKSKEKGGNNYSFYATTFLKVLADRMHVIQALKSAIKNREEFVLYYQPKISIKTQKIVGVEALIRWNSPELGFVRPDEFITIAEKTHMIIDIGHWVLLQACSDFMKLKEGGYSLGLMSVNVSGVQLEYSDMLETTKEVMTQTHIMASELELEVTESYIATNEASAIETLTRFRDMGIELAIDDFGTGYSSMSYLQALPISRLKIDKAFVDNIANSEGSVAIVKAIIALAEALSLKITVEGVEFQEQLEFFKDKYCDDIQGYFYSKPLTFSELKEFIKLQDIDN